MAGPEEIRGRLSEEQITEVAGRIDVRKGMFDLAKNALRESGHANQVGGGVELSVIHERLEPRVQKALEQLRAHLTPDATPDQLKEAANHIVDLLIIE